VVERVRFLSPRQTAELNSLSPRREHHEIRVAVRYVGDRQCDTKSLCAEFTICTRRLAGDPIPPERLIVGSDGARRRRGLLSGSLIPLSPVLPRLAFEERHTRSGAGAGVLREA